MSLHEYVVLRIPSRSKSDLETLGHPAIAGEKELHIETGDLSKKEIRELDRNPEAVLARVMPMKLHEPVEQKDVEVTNQGEVWGLQAIGAFSSPFTGKGITVAVLDTGIDAAHSAFQGMKLVQKDFTGEGDGDGHGHGSHVAGTIFGQKVDGLRIGVAPGIDRALIGKVLGSRGGGSTRSILEAIQWAISNGANVISMSLGIDFPGMVARLIDGGYPKELATSLALEGYRDNINLFNTIGAFAARAGDVFQPVILIAASGNESRRSENPKHEIAAAPPAAAEGIKAIGALGQSPEGLVVAPFSNTKVDISAPGVGILSARSGGGLRIMSGTSMATPYVAGVAALWGEQLKSALGAFRADDLLAKLIASGTHAPLKAGFDPLDVGMGIVQAPQ